MNLTNLMKMLAPFSDLDYDDMQVHDLSTDEGLKGFNKQLDQIENAELDVLNSFGINSKEWIKSMRDLGQKIHDQNKKNDIIKKSVNQMKRKEEDHSKELEDNFVRPSQKLSINQKLQLHKIVQEYVDKMIKPYNNGLLTNQQINDAYAGLYEFAAWLMNR
jgi:hypothetical protein